MSVNTRLQSRSLSTSIASLLPVLAILATLPAIHAADVVKANNATALNDAASYTPAGLPTAADVIVYDATVAAANTSSALGGDLSVAGLRIANPGGTVTISATSGATLTLGGSGIDLTAAAQNLTLANATALGASQTWDVNSSRTLTQSGSLNLGSSTLTVTNAGITTGITTISGLILGTGGFVKNGAGVLNISSAAGSGNSFSTGNLFSGGITHSAGTLNITAINASGTGLITTSGTLVISAAQLLLTGGITINGGATTLSAADSGGSGTVTLNSGGTLAITGVSTGTRLANVVLNAGGTFNPFTSVQFGTLSGALGFTAGAGTLTFGGNNGTATYTGNIGGAVASLISKVGSGTQILDGTNATTGTITANGSGGTLEIGGQYGANAGLSAQSGTLRLNFGTNNTVATNLVNATTLSLSGGTLAVTGQNTATNVIQNFTTSTTTAGTSSTVSATNGVGGGTTALNIGAIVRGAGSVINFNLPSGLQSATNGILTSTGAPGIFVGSGNQAYTTVNGTDFAAKDATNTFVQALTGSVTATGGTTLTGTATDQADITGANVSVSAASMINTVRFNDSAARTLTLTTGALTVTQSGILISSAVTAPGSTITGAGTITSATDVIIHQFSPQPFTLNSAVTGAGVILTKAGPGTLILTKANTNGGTTYVTSGMLQIGTGGSLQNSVVSLAPNNPTAVFNLNNQTASVSNLSGGGATGGYVTLGSSGTLNDIGNNSSTFSGALVGGVNSVLNKTGGSQGIQGPNQAFYGTVNVATGSTIGIFGGGGFINATVNVNGGTFNQGSSGTVVAFGNLGGTGGTLTVGSNASAGGTYNIGYLGGASSFAGVVANGTNATPGVTNLGKFGSGTTTLSGASTYTGTTIINSGGLTFDYATAIPLPIASALTVGGGTATFLGAASGATAISTGTFGVSNSVFSRVTVNASTGTGTALTLKTAVINGANILGSTNTNNNVLFDLSSSAGNSLLTDLAIGAATTAGADTIAIRTNNGLLTSGVGNAGLTGYRANVLIKDSTGLGFAQASGTTISRYTAATTLTVADAGATLLETTNYKISNSTLTRTTAAFFYNTLELDSSTAPAALVSTVDTFTRFGAGVASVSGRGVLATGSNGAAITSGGGTNQATYFNNYQTGTTAGQTLTLNMNLAGISYFNGTGLTVATGLVNSNDQYFQSGVTRLTGAQSSGDALSPGTGGVYRLLGGILEIGADLTGSTTATSTADFSRPAGAQAGQVSLRGDTGFSAFGANRTVNLGGASQQLLWGNDDFLTTPSSGTTEGNNTFRLSSTFADSTIEFQNPIALGNITRQVDVANGTAAVDARLSGVLSGVFVNTVTLANGAPAVLNAAAGLTKLGAGTLELTGANTYRGQTTISTGILSIGGGGATGSLSPVGALVNNATLTFNRSNTLTQGTDFASVISGTGAVFQSGTSASVTILNGANTHSGPTTVTAGTLALANVNAVQNSTLDTGTAGAQTVSLTVAGPNTYNLGGLQGADDLAIGGNVLSVGANNQSTVYSGTLAGGAGSGLTKVGNGTLGLSGAQTYATLTTTSGTTNVNGAFTGGTATVNANATTNFGTSQTLAALNIGAGAVVTLTATPPFAPLAGAVVPEPGSAALLAGGVVTLLGLRRRRTGPIL